MQASTMAAYLPSAANAKTARSVGIAATSPGEPCKRSKPRRSMPRCSKSPQHEHERKPWISDLYMAGLPQKHVVSGTGIDVSGTRAVWLDKAHYTHRAAGTILLAEGSLHKANR